MVARFLPLLLVTLFGLAGAREAILDFQAELELRPGGHLAVVENLTVRIEHDRVVHGLYRDLLARPLGSLAPAAGSIRYRIEEVRLDGRPEPWWSESNAQGLRVYMGRPETLAPLGVHRYTLRYRADYAGRRAGDLGRLDWNVTGNDWALPIERTTLRLHLPAGLSADAVRARAYAGPLGSTDEVAGVRIGNGWVFRYDGTLPPGSGLTLELSWPLALLPVDRAPADPLVRVLATVLLLFALLLTAVWVRQGRDPRPGAVIPRFRPPEGVSAALVAYLANHNLTPRVFTAAVAELAARGFLKVTDGPNPLLERVATDPPDERTPLELRALFEALLPPHRARIELSQANAEEIRQARSELGRRLRKKVAPYLRPNFAALLTTLGVAVLTVGSLVRHLSGEFALGAFAGLATFFYLAFAVAALQSAALAWDRYRLVPGLSPLGELLRIAFRLLFVFGGALVGGFFLGLYAGMAVGGLAAAIVLVAAWGAYPLPAYTPAGAEVWRHLQGLARYLGTTDAAELRRMNAPEDTPEALRRLYPYAIALGIESRFADRLERYLRVHPQESGRVLLWGTDRGAPQQARMAGFSTGVSRALQAAFVRATASRSGSAGRSGGFSGGGGGGGGGGGW